MTTGKLKAIWIKRGHGAPMDSVESAEAEAGRGLAGNADRGGRRQVTIIEEEVWGELMEQFDAELPPLSRRANLMVEGIRLAHTQGKTLQVGECQIRIYNVTAPCRAMDDLIPGLQEAMRPDWRGGAFGEVINDSTLRVGDTVRWAETE